jgi:hypothetical protein
MTPKLDGRNWIGTASAYGTCYHVELCESQCHPGYYYYAIWCGLDKFLEDTKRPLNATMFEGMLDDTLQKYGLRLDDVTWREASRSEMILLIERLREDDRRLQAQMREDEEARRIEDEPLSDEN